MAGGLFALPKMHKITQNSLLKKHGIFCLTFSCAHCAHFLLDKRARRVYTPIIKMAQIGKKPEFPRAERGAFAVSILRKRPAVPPLSRPRNKRDGIARYSGHKRRKMRKQGGTVE